MTTKIIVGLVLLILVGGGVFFATRGSDTPEPEAAQGKKKTKITEPVNVIPMSERPYILVSPTADKRNVTIAVDALKKEATDVDYELEYQSGSLLQGAFGLITLDSLPATTKILLGSCSAGGACTYHEDVQGGSLTTRFSGTENYALKTDWKYIELTDGESEISSRDAKFQLSGADIADIDIAIIADSSGVPAGLEGTPVSAPYTLQTVPTLSGTASLSIRANEEGELSIAGWNGEEWTVFETTIDGKTATAEVKLMELYVVVKSE